MTRSSSRLALPFLLGACIAHGALAEETVGTLTLDGLSFISFGNEQVLLIPPGATLQFHFGEVAADGSIRFTIAPADLSFPPIPIPGSGGSLTYSLGAVASGVVTPTADGRKIEFTASVNASLAQGGAGGSYTYVMPFTTEYVSASNRAGTLTLETFGMRLVEGAWYLQLVGATTNHENAFPKPGTAVYTVLSGQFDQMP